MYKIYSLKDPFTQEILYVGITKSELLRRLVGHLHEIYYRDRLVKDKQQWIESLLSQGVVPSIELLELTDDKSREKYWIELYTPKYNIQHNNNEYYKDYLSGRRSLVVYQYSLEGIFLKEWASITKAAEFYNIEGTNIGSCVSLKRRHAGGYMWTDFKKDSIKPYKKDIFMKKVHVYDLEGNYIISYDSARHVPNRTYKAVYKVCQGILHSHKGNRYSYEKVSRLQPIVKRKYGTGKVKI
jgi:hypothetical protein